MNKFYKVMLIFLTITLLAFFGILTFQFIDNTFYEGSHNTNETLIILLLNVILQNLVYKDIRKE